MAALCFALADEPQVADVLAAYLAVFTSHYLSAKLQYPVDPEDAAHQHLRAMCRSTEQPSAPDNG